VQQKRQPKPGGRSSGQSLSEFFLQLPWDALVHPWGSTPHAASRSPPLPRLPAAALSFKAPRTMMWAERQGCERRPGWMAGGYRRGLGRQRRRRSRRALPARCLLAQRGGQGTLTCARRPVAADRYQFTGKCRMAAFVLMNFTVSLSLLMNPLKRV